MKSGGLSGIILFGHGARHAQWAEPFHRIRAAMRLRAPEILVELAFLENMSPTLSEAVDALAAAGVAHIRIVPVFIASGGHLVQDLPRMAAQAGARHPQIAFVIAAPMGEADPVIEAMATHALASS